MSTRPGPVFCSAPKVTSNPPLSGLLYVQPVEVETSSFPFFLNMQDVKSKTVIRTMSKALNLYITPLVLWLLRILKYNKIL
jgi:hypothetical protein